MSYITNPLHDPRPTDAEMLANIPAHAIGIEWNLSPDITCADCGDWVSGPLEPHYAHLDPDNTLCYPCAMNATGTLPTERN